MKVVCFWFEKTTAVEILAEHFLRLSPQICWRKNQALFIEIGKCQRLYSENHFLARAQVILRRNQLQPRWAVADRLLESLVLARYNCPTLEEAPIKALVDVVDPLAHDEMLRKNTLEMLKAFQDLGLHTLKDFKKIPASHLISRFGVLGRVCHSRVVAAEDVRWPAWSPKEIIEEKKDFPSFEFYGELEPLLFELKAQLDQIFYRLRARQRRLTALEIVLHCEKTSFHPHFLRRLHFDFFVPQGITAGTLRIIKERLSKEFEKRPLLSPLETLESRVLKSTPLQQAQKNFFNNQEEKFEQMHSLHNQLIELLGKENVFHAELLQDRRPERSWQKTKEAPHQPHSESLAWLQKIPQRSLYLLRHPLKIEVTAGWIHIRKKPYRILHWDPEIESINGGWVENPKSPRENSYNRIYHRIEIEGSHRLSVFETPERCFYLQGYDG